MSAEQNEVAKRWITQQLHDFWRDRYRAYRLGEEPTGAFLAGHAIAPSPQLPVAVQTSYQFYNQTVMQPDWGSVYLYRVPIPNQSVYVVYVTTDGDDGWLELYDAQGNLLGAARRYIELLFWGELNAIRAMVQTGEFPPGCDRDATLWKP